MALTELDDDTAAAIAGLGVFEQRDAEGNGIGQVKKWISPTRTRRSKRRPRSQGCMSATTSRTAQSRSSLRSRPRRHRIDRRAL